MKIKITFDPDGAYGYPKDGIIDAKQLVNDYIENLNEVEDAETISFLKRQPLEKSVDFVAEMWRLDYDIIPLAKIRKCAICGKLITEGYLFDGTTAFCDKDCAASFFDDNEGCVEILIDEGDRLKWHDEFPKREHYRVNIGHSSPDCFHHFDNEQTMFRWISEIVGEEIRSFDDCEGWTRKQDDEHGLYIEILRLNDLEKFYKNRREYAQCLRDIVDLWDKARRLPDGQKRDYLIRLAGKRYEDANWYYEKYPEVWQGEI